MHFLRNIAPRLQRFVLLILIPSFWADAIGYRKICFLVRRTSGDHQSNRFCGKEDLRHPMTREPCTDVLAVFGTDSPNIRKAVIGISHD